MQELNDAQKLEVDAYYIRPKTANERMKAAQSTGQTVYICGAVGFGKTSFVADYLSRRRYEYYSMEHIGLEEIPVIHKKETKRIVVVDDLHMITETEERENACKVFGQLAKSPGVWLILIGRCLLPAWLKPLYIQQVFLTIGETELSFSEKEEEIYLKKWNLELSQKAKKRLRNLGGGHPMFLRIAALRLKGLAGDKRSTEERIEEELSTIEEARCDWWDYLETYVYDQWNVELQEFLMDISIVEQFDLSMARMITKKMDAGRLIKLAQENGNILSVHTAGDREIYELRTPVKKSMRRMLRNRCSMQHIDVLYYNAACSYELQGKIVEALVMYEKCHNEEGISRLLIENARKYPGIGYYWELRRYYLGLSEHTVRQSPELMAGMSLLQSILLNDEESEKWYQALLEYEKSQSGSMKKEAKARLFYLDIALPQRGTRHMTDVLKKTWTVGVGILAWLSVINNHMDNAMESLESFRSGVTDMAQLLTGIDTLKTRFDLYMGRSSEVADWMKQAPDEEAEFCTLERYRYITKVRVYLSVGRREKALRLLLQLQFYAEKRERIFLQIEVKILACHHPISYGRRKMEGNIAARN